MEKLKLRLKKPILSLNGNQIEVPNTNETTNQKAPLFLDSVIFEMVSKFDSELNKEIIGYRELCIGFLKALGASEEFVEVDKTIIDKLIKILNHYKYDNLLYINFLEAIIVDDGTITEETTSA